MPCILFETSHVIPCVLFGPSQTSNSKSKLSTGNPAFGLPLALGCGRPPLLGCARSQNSCAVHHMNVLFITAGQPTRFSFRVSGTMTRSQNGLRFHRLSFEFTGYTSKGSNFVLGRPNSHEYALSESEMSFFASGRHLCAKTDGSGLYHQGIPGKWVSRRTEVFSF